jgi:hypothetical protein
MQVCEEFKLPVTGVVEGLAVRAVRLSNSRPLEQSAAWQWLADNRPGNISPPVGDGCGGGTGRPRCPPLSAVVRRGSGWPMTGYTRVGR